MWFLHIVNQKQGDLCQGVSACGPPVSQTHVNMLFVVFVVQTFNVPCSPVLMLMYYTKFHCGA